MRHRRRNMRKVVGVLLLAGAGAVVWNWPMIRESARQGSLSPLAGLVASSDQQSALRKVDTPTHPSSPPTASPRPTLEPPRLSTPSTLPAKKSTDGLTVSNPSTTLPPSTIFRITAPTSQPSSIPVPAIDPAKATADFQAGMEALKGEHLLEARERLNRALHQGLTLADAKTARQALTDLADKTVLSKTVVKGDTLCSWHSVKAGDTLGKLARRCKISEPLLADINTLGNRHLIREGSRIKLIEGPFHANINKRDHEMHVYLQGLYVRTIPVALGEGGSTPAGTWKVANQLANPGWTDPRTGKRWHPDDPANPIGEYWIGLQGIDGEAAGQPGYGIHGTIEPDTIGKDVSMGCIRLGTADVAWAYKLLLPNQSIVTITE
ncbi:MAG TPA: L,D-transpeptidase family protein [Phycisphaerae bacterium]|nr:L,D-transpeptidase family protein [Phycisphaerae bacterium]HRY70805.1 L,D-transpeptidase family protein [Phycisphaerae bacterium]